MRVPASFKIAADEPNTVWIGYPAYVQKEEEPLNWIQSKGVVDGLSVDDLDTVRKEALEIANLTRSIDFDTRSTGEDPDSIIAQLVGSVRTDIQSSAKNLCGRNEATLRSSAWSASQATEKAIKILIRRYGKTSPPCSHKLPSLAQPPQQVQLQCRIDTPKELECYRRGGILPFVLRRFL